MPKLPPLSGYCPPGQLRSMSRRLAQQALRAQQRRHWLVSELPARRLPSPYLSWLLAAAVGLALLGTLKAKVHAGPLALPEHRPAYERPASADFYESDTTDL